MTLTGEQARKRLAALRVAATLRWELLAPVIVAAAMTACASPSAIETRREALSALDDVAAAVAPDLPVAENGGPVEVEQCAWIPGWPTSKRAWEAWRRYGLRSVDSKGRVDRAVEHVRSRGGSVVVERDDPRTGRSVRLALNGLDVFVSTRPVLELKVRSRCFDPE